MPQYFVKFIVPHFSNGSAPAFEPSESLRASTAAVNVGQSVEGGLGTPEFVWSHGEPHRPWQAILGKLCGLSYASDGLHLPAAALLCPDEVTPVVCASPVHLQPDRDSAVLLPPAQLALDESESLALLNDLNAFVRQDGMRFFQAGAEWYLSAQAPCRIPAYPPSFVAYRNATAFLPEGAQAGPWRRLMSELQMLLFSHSVNQAREHSGKPTVNSLWLWGGAALPEHTAPLPATEVTELTVHADDDYSRALAAQAGMRCLPVSAFDPISARQCIVVDTRLSRAAGDEAQRHQRERSIIQEWLEPLRQRLQTDELAEVRLYDERGSSGLLQMADTTATDDTLLERFKAATASLQQIPWRFGRRK